MAKQSKAKLIGIINNARSKLDAIENKEKEKELKPLVGQHFKYHNSYGSGESWWLYRKVLKLTDEIWLKVFDFEKTSSGEWNIHFNDTALSVSNGYKSITEEEFNQAWKECLVEISNYNLKKVKK